MHVGGHLREAFVELIETGEMPGAEFWYDGKPKTERWLRGKLWRCTDVMPAALCAYLGLVSGSTYANATHQADE